MLTFKYVVSAVIKGQLVLDTFYVKTERQAWFRLGKKHGFAMRDFKTLNKELKEGQVV
jgi:hypothetical protein